MRIISGIKKSIIIKAPKNLPVRPTTDKVKESLFNIILNKFNLNEISVLDLFSGTGNVSYEFASRGCLNLLSIDNNHNCIKFINKTASKLELNIKTKKIDYKVFLKKNKKKFDIIFGNPPHFNFDDDWKPENQEEFDLYDEDRKHLDKDWKIHRDFFSNVSEYLEEDGCILLMENIKGSNLGTFNNMITENNLRVTQAFPSKEWPEDIWYMKVQHA